MIDLQSLITDQPFKMRDDEAEALLTIARGLLSSSERTHDTYELTMDADLAQAMGAALLTGLNEIKPIGGANE